MKDNFKRKKNEHEYFFGVQKIENSRAENLILYVISFLEYHLPKPHKGKVTIILKKIYIGNCLSINEHTQVS